MSTSHPPVEQLTRILARPQGDTERTHVEGCERCQASLTAMQEFLSLDVANAPELAQDDARLAAMVQGIVGTGAKAAAPAKVLQMPARARRTNLPGLLAIAACLAFVSAIVVMRRPDAPAQFRGDVSAAEVKGAQASESAPGIELRWDAYPGAGLYRVQVFDSQVHEVANYGPIAQTRWSIPADSLAALSARVPVGETLTWQVTGLSGRDALAHSGWLRLPLAGR
jgi:hypothetical protein